MALRLRPGRRAMSSHLSVIASLALALLLSPETLVLGLVVASDKRTPRLAAWMYALGALLGVAFALAVGMSLAAHHPDSEAARVDRARTWGHFAVHAVLALAVLAIGIRRAISAAEATPVPDVSEPEHKPGRLWTWVKEHFPRFAHQVDPEADLSVPGRARRAALAGFAMCGLHPKVFPIAIAAGHQVADLPVQEHALGLALFAAMATFPAFFPAILEVVRPGGSAKAKQAVEEFTKVHGRSIVALLLIGAGLFLARGAWNSMPG